MFQLLQIFKTKHCISEASSGETAHLKVPIQNICVSVAYMTDTNYNNITINNYKNFSHNFHIFMSQKFYNTFPSKTKKTTVNFHSCTMHLGKYSDKTTALTFFSHIFTY